MKVLFLNYVGDSIEDFQRIFTQTLLSNVGDFIVYVNVRLNFGSELKFAIQNAKDTYLTNMHMNAKNIHNTIQ